MWTYKIFKVSTVVPLCRPISCALSSQCVQNNSHKLNLQRSIPHITVLRYRSQGYSSIVRLESQSLEKFTEPQPTLEDQLEVDGSKFEESELEKQRFIWNVGPVLRPSSSIASFVNDSILLQTFVKMGVELYRWDKLDPKDLEYLLKLDFDKDVAPYVRFFHALGISPDELKPTFSKNPLILREDLDNLQTRIQYLKSKAFTPQQVQSIIRSEPFWLSLSTTDLDQRLGYFQTTFKLSGTQIRELAMKGARTVTTKRSQLMEVTFSVKEEMGFEPNEIVSMLLHHPSIWRQRAPTLTRRFAYIHNEVKFSHETIARSPKLLLTREGKLKSRIGFLRHVSRAQFNPDKPNFVSVDDLVEEDDSHFAVVVAKSSVSHYNDYLKTL